MCWSITRGDGAPTSVEAATKSPRCATCATTPRVPIDDLISIDVALGELQALNPRLVTVVEMRFFGGFEDREIAEQLQVSTRTVERDWLKARLFLVRALAHA